VLKLAMLGKNIITIQEIALKRYLPSQEAFASFEESIQHSEKINLYERSGRIVEKLESLLQENPIYLNYLQKAETFVFQPQVMLLKYFVNLLACIEYVHVYLHTAGHPAVSALDIVNILQQDVEYTNTILEFLITIIYERTNPGSV
jgi:uncharacterized membrane protein (DUF485 family)